MDKFEELLNAMEQKNKKAEQREIVVVYDKDKEEEAFVVRRTPAYPGHPVQRQEGLSEDGYALLFAAAKLIDEASGADEKELSEALIEVVIKCLAKDVITTLKKGLEEISHE